MSVGPRDFEFLRVFAWIIKIQTPSTPEDAGFYDNMSLSWWYNSMYRLISRWMACCPPPFFSSPSRHQLRRRLFIQRQRAAGNSCYRSNSSLSRWISPTFSFFHTTLIVRLGIILRTILSTTCSSAPWRQIRARVPNTVTSRKLAPPVSRCERQKKRVVNDLRHTQIGISFFQVLKITPHLIQANCQRFGSRLWTPLWKITVFPTFPNLITLFIQMAPTPFPLRFVQEPTNAGFQEIYGMLLMEFLLALSTTAPLLLVVYIDFYLSLSDGYIQSVYPGPCELFEFK